MRKRDELQDPTSCLSKARNTEMLFVLLARDGCAPQTIRYWCKARVAAGKNRWDDPQIMEALACALSMEREERHAAPIHMVLDPQECTETLWRPCVICGDSTYLACSDCMIDKNIAVHVCGKAECRSKHERECVVSGR